MNNEGELKLILFQSAHVSYDVTYRISRHSGRFHHKFAESGGSPLAFVVHMADAIALMSGVGMGLDGLQYDLDQEAMIQPALEEDDISEITQQVVQSVQEITEAM
ncbi:MAG: hypothetical protein WAL98_08830 [Desulfatiglandaceae bacterium]|jgi:hypothetical protein